ncbi:MAG: oligosaccharide flippase family protein [Bacilli bacterium]
MKQSIAYDAVKLSTAKIITLLISMISAMLLSRFRTLEEYGTYSQLLLVINLVTTIFMVGLPNSINFFLARAESDKERQKYLSVFYTLTTVLSLITGLVLVLSTSLIIDYFNNPYIRKFMYVLAVYPWTKIVLSSIDHIYIVYQKTTHLMLFRILNSTYLLIIILIVEKMNWGFNEYMALFVFGESIFALSVYIIVKNIAGKIYFSFDKDLILRILNFSIPIGLATVVGTLKIEFDKLLIGRFFNTEQLAIYTNAAREMPVTFVAASITAVLMPQIVKLLKKDDKCKAVDLWKHATSLSYLIICFFAAGIFTYAPEVITLLYSEKYIPGVSVFRVYSIDLLFRCTYFGMILNSIGKTKTIFYNSVLALIINIILNFVFYYLLGFIGPAIATLVATLFSATFLLLSTSKTLNMSIKNIFPWGDIFKITIVNIGFCVVFFWAKNLLAVESILGEVIESILLGAIWGVIYFSLTFAFIKKKWLALNVK